MALNEYRAKRNFKVTPEPAPRLAKTHKEPIFVVQEHHARRLHYDVRLEADGVLKSWAVPKVPTLDPSQKRLAVHVEDHPLDYAYFQGQIPTGQYGAGDVSIWEHGTYENRLALKRTTMTVTQGIAAGLVEVFLQGKKLKGGFALVRLHGRDGGKDNWLLIKMKDEFARPGSETESNGAAKAATPTSTPKKNPKATPNATPRKMPVLTHPDKVIFPESGITKAEVFEFYKKIAPRLLPHVRDRPATLERLPEGVTQEGPHFWQKNAPEYYPSWIQRAELPTKD